MNFIQQAYKGHYEWWRYLVGTAIVFIFWQLIGVLPLMGSIFIKYFKEGNIEEMARLNEDTLMTVFDSNTTLFLMLIMFVFGLLGIYLVVKYFHENTMKNLTTTRNKIDWSRFMFGFGLVAIFTLVMTGIDYYSNPDDYVVQFNLIPFLIMAVIAILLIPLQTSMEEYFFRGYLMQGIGALVKNRWVPLIVTSVIFGLLHIANPEVDKLGPIIMVYYIGTGLFLGIITLMDEGMELALGFHAANNLIGVILVTADWTVFQTNSLLKDVSEPEVGIDILIPVLIIYPLFLYIMSRKYNWSDWKEKLTGRIEEPSVIE
jgi:membrane protease YdiL (CAAX protease family)